MYKWYNNQMPNQTLKSNQNDNKLKKHSVQNNKQLKQGFIYTMVWLKNNQIKPTKENKHINKRKTENIIW